MGPYRRWIIVPVIVLVWCFLPFSFSGADRVLGVELFLAVVLAGLIVTGILGTYILRTFWSILVVPGSIQAGLIVASIIFRGSNDDFSWDIYILFFAVSMVILFTTSGTAAGTTAYLMHRKSSSNDSPRTRMLAPPALVLIFIAWVGGYFTFGGGGSTPLLVTLGTAVSASMAIVLGVTAVRRADADVPEFTAVILALVSGGLLSCVVFWSFL